MRGSHIRQKAKYDPKRGRLSDPIVANQAEESRKIATLFSNNRIKRNVWYNHAERERIILPQRSVGGDELLAVAAWFVGKGHADGTGANERLEVALKSVLS